MSTLDPKNNDRGQPSGKIETSDLNLDSAIDKENLQAEQETELTEPTRDLTGPINLLLSTEKEKISTDNQETAVLFPPTQHPSEDSIETMAFSTGKKMNTNDSSNSTQKELNDIDSVGVVQSVGHILRRARTEKGMSIEDVARQLRLSVQQITSIEKEDYEKLPGRTFLRGFIRNYANLVQLDPQPLLQLLPESAPIISTYERTPFKNKQISFSSNRENSINLKIIMILVICFSAIGAYFFFESDGSESGSTSSEVKLNSDKASIEIQLPLSINNANTNSSLNMSESKSPVTRVQAIGENPEENSQIESGDEVKLENKSVATSTDHAITVDMGSLHFKFVEDSWIKVTDASGASLFEQLQPKGSEKIINGSKPLSVVIGNASGVKLTYNKSEVNISSHRRQDGTARFTLD